MQLILASGSRYRRTLLEQLQCPFRVISPDVDETPGDGEAPAALARRLALAKAEAVFRRHPDAAVIGSDQVATLDGRSPIGKPGTVERARAQLLAASGRTMLFHTAVAILAPGRRPIEECVEVQVRFRPLTPARIDRYLALEPALDCAGSARCDGLGITLLESIETTDPSALIGLPLIRVAAALAQLGLDPLAAPADGATP